MTASAREKEIEYKRESARAKERKRGRDWERLLDYPADASAVAAAAAAAAAHIII